MCSWKLKYYDRNEISNRMFYLKSFDLKLKHTTLFVKISLINIYSMPTVIDHRKKFEMLCNKCKIFTCSIRYLV